jgi:hypothetical protein
VTRVQKLRTRAAWCVWYWALWITDIIQGQAAMDAEMDHLMKLGDKKYGRGV